MSVADLVGNWLSIRRFRSTFGSLRGKRFGDIGCGYRAQFLRPVLHELEQAILVDLSIDESLGQRPNVRLLQGLLPDVLESEPESLAFDGIVCNNVLEHLWEPQRTVAQIRRHLKPGGVAFVNVPSWRGKLVLETLAFRMNAPSRPEIDDHKMYYAKSDLWRVLVAGGFKPSELRLGSHKLTLNTYAVCTKQL